MTSTADRRTGLRIAAGLASFLLVSLFVVETSQAAFTATATNNGNSVEVATLDLESDATVPLFAHTGTPLADTSDMVPGQTEVACLVLTYTGSTTSVTEVLLDATAATNSATYGSEFAVRYEVDESRTSCPASPTIGAGVDGSWTLNNAPTGLSTGWTPSASGEQAIAIFEVTFDGDGSLTAPPATAQVLDSVDLTFSISTS